MWILIDQMLQTYKLNKYTLQLYLLDGLERRDKLGSCGDQPMLRLVFLLTSSGGAMAYRGLDQ